MKKLLLTVGLCIVTAHTLHSAHSSAYTNALNHMIALGFNQDEAEAIVSAEDDIQLTNALEAINGVDIQDAINAIRGEAITRDLAILEDEPDERKERRRNLRAIATILLTYRNLEQEDMETFEYFLNPPARVPQRDDQELLRQQFVASLTREKEAVTSAKGLSTQEKLDLLTAFSDAKHAEFKKLSKDKDASAQTKKKALDKFLKKLNEELATLREQAGKEKAQIRLSERKPPAEAKPLQPGANKKKTKAPLPPQQPRRQALTGQRDQTAQEVRELESSLEALRVTQPYSDPYDRHDLTNPVYHYLRYYSDVVVALTPEQIAIMPEEENQINVTAILENFFYFTNYFLGFDNETRTRNKRIIDENMIGSVVYHPNDMVNKEQSIVNLEQIQDITPQLAIFRDFLIAYIRITNPLNKEAIQELSTYVDTTTNQCTQFATLDDRALNQMATDLYSVIISIANQDIRTAIPLIFVQTRPSSTNIRTASRSAVMNEINHIKEYLDSVARLGESQRGLIQIIKTLMYCSQMWTPENEDAPLSLAYRRNQLVLFNYLGENARVDDIPTDTRGMADNREDQ